LLLGWHARCRANVEETRDMPEDNQSVFDALMQTFNGQMWVALEQWRKVTDMEGPLHEAMKPWLRGGVPFRTAVTDTDRNGKISKIGCQMSDFNEFDELIANIGRFIDQYCASMQGMQATLDKMHPLFESVTTGSHGDVLVAAYNDLPTMVAQATAAQAAWTRGMGAFMPRYRKAKLEVADNFKTMTQKK
jgi:hypothetical protein